MIFEYLMIIGWWDREGEKLWERREGCTGRVPNARKVPFDTWNRNAGVGDGLQCSWIATPRAGVPAVESTRTTVAFCSDRIPVSFGE